jgi:hypothetical protein
MNPNTLLICLVAAVLNSVEVRGQFQTLPFLERVPSTQFTCRERNYGYYSDVSANCQAFHICLGNQKWSFLCPNQTQFNQEVLVCDYPEHVDCPNAERHYITNDRFFATDAPPIEHEESESLSRDKNRGRRATDEVQQRQVLEHLAAALAPTRT